MAWAIFIVVLAALGWISWSIQMIAESHTALGVITLLIGLPFWSWVIWKVIGQSKEKGKNPPLPAVSGTLKSSPPGDAAKRYVGRSVLNAFGGYNHFDTNGKWLGRSNRGVFEEFYHFDENKKELGKSVKGAFGCYNHFGRAYFFFR